MPVPGVPGTALHYSVTGRSPLEEFLRFGSALRSGINAYDRADEQMRKHCVAIPRQVLAEWDPHPFGVMHEHVPLRAIVRMPVALTWILGGESSPWLAGLHERVSRRRSDIKPSWCLARAISSTSTGPDGFTAAIRAAAGQRL